MSTTADLLREYGSALRGSWGDIDGRSEKQALHALADAIETHGSTALSESEQRRLREELGVCPDGGGHWAYFCYEGWTECGGEQA